MNAGAAGTQYGVLTSINQGGGNKKQGLVSTTNARAQLIYPIRTRGGGQNRNLVFCMNQLGGVGRRWGQASGPGNRGGVSANCQRLAHRRRLMHSAKLGDPTPLPPPFSPGGGSTDVQECMDSQWGAPQTGGPCCVNQYEKWGSANAVCNMTTPCLEGYLPGTVVGNFCNVTWNKRYLCPEGFTKHGPVCIHGSCQSQPLQNMVCGQDGGRFESGHFYDSSGNKWEDLQPAIDAKVVTIVQARDSKATDWDWQCCPPGYSVGPICVYGSCNTKYSSVPAYICGKDDGSFSHGLYTDSSGNTMESLCDGMAAGVLTYGSPA